MSHRRDDWTLTPELMVRVAGLPVETLEGLRCPDTLAWAEEVLTAEAWLRADAQALSDDLGNVVAGVEDKTRRARLLKTRRDIFNLRRPAEGPFGLDPALQGRLDRWVEGLRRLEALRAQGEDRLAVEMPRARAALRGLLVQPRLRAGLLLASPGLDAQLDAYAAAPPIAADKRARKVERSAVSYVYRTVAKPSPFSTFTGVALGRVSAHSRGVAEHASVPGEWTSQVRVNVVALTRLAEAVAADPERRGDLVVRPASGWGRDADRVRYVRRSLRTGDTAATVTFDSARDQLFFLRRSQVLEGMLAMAADAPALLHRELVTGLAEQLGADPEQCEQYVATLLELGLLQVPLLATNVHAADPLRTFRDALRGLCRPWSGRLADLLEDPIRCLEDYPAGTPAQRRTLLAALRRGLGAAMEFVGSSGEALPSTLVYEDVRASRVPLPWSGDGSTGSVAEVAGALRTLERVLPAFDLTLRHRLTLQGFFLARHGVGGRCEDVLRLVHDFHEDIYDEYLSWVSRHPNVDGSGRLSGDPNFLGDRRIAGLDRARRAFADRLGQLLAATPDAAEIEVRADLVDAVAAELGVDAGGTGLAARTHFLQQAGDGLVVHNQVHGGLAFPFSRFTHCFAEDGLVERLRHRARAVAPPGAVLAEVTGGSATTNLNLHHRLTDYEIVCPGETSTALPDQRIDLADLILEHDPHTHRLLLRSRRLGREVVPVYLGYLLPQALPAISRTLLLLSTSAIVWFEPWAGVPVADGKIRHRPRLRLGPLVLARRSWTLRARDLPADIGGPAEQFLTWQRWRRTHGLPLRVFTTVHPPGGVGRRRPKPQLLDLGSELSLRSFRAALTHPDSRVELTEALPDLGRAWVRSPAGHHVAELAVETVSPPMLAITHSGNAHISTAKRSA